MSLLSWMGSSNKQEQTTSVIPNTSISYTHIKKRSARLLRITIKPNGTVTVTTPLHISTHDLKDYLTQKASWIEEKLTYLATLPQAPDKITRERLYTSHKEAARKHVLKLLEEINHHYNFTYNKVTIKNHSTLWGSCSRKANLNFNYRILHLPLPLARYIVAHELCHLREFNHSQRFWNLVAQTIPNHKELRKELKKQVFGILQ